MSTEELRKAVERLEFRLRGVWEPQADVHADWQTIRARLVELEAEVERLQDSVNSLGLESAEHFVRGREWAERCGKQEARAERAEAWLRKALGQVLSNIGFMAMHKVTDGSIESAKEVHDGITAHLSENSRG